MRLTRLVAIAAATTATTLTLSGAPANAQQEPDPLPVTVTPDRGNAGAAISFSGEGCLSDGVLITLEHTGDSGRKITIPMGADANGAWSASYTIRDTDPLGQYTVNTTCYDTVTETFTMTPLFDYAEASFEITDAEAPPAPTMSISVTPTSGPIGTTVAVSGTDCAGDEVEFALLAGTGIDDVTAIVDAWSMEPADDGSWSGELLVYDTMIPATGDDAEIDVVPGGDYFVAAACVFYPTDAPEAPSPDEIIFSDTVGFDITGDGTAPRSDPPPATEIVPAQAQPATPVAGNPSYTG